MKKCYLRYKIVCFIIVRVVFFIGNKIKNECKLFLIILVYGFFVLLFICSLKEKR